MGTIYIYIQYKYIQQIVVFTINKEGSPVGVPSFSGMVNNKYSKLPISYTGWMVAESYGKLVKTHKKRHT